MNLKKKKKKEIKEKGVFGAAGLGRERRGFRLLELVKLFVWVVSSCQPRSDLETGAASSTEGWGERMIYLKNREICAGIPRSLLRVGSLFTRGLFM